MSRPTSLYVFSSDIPWWILMASLILLLDTWSCLIFWVLPGCNCAPPPPPVLSRCLPTDGHYKTVVAIPWRRQRDSAEDSGFFPPLTDSVSTLCRMWKYVSRVQKTFTPKCSVLFVFANCLKKVCYIEYGHIWQLDWIVCSFHKIWTVLEWCLKTQHFNSKMCKVSNARVIKTEKEVMEVQTWVKCNSLLFLLPFFWGLPRLLFLEPLF